MVFTHSIEDCSELPLTSSNPMPIISPATCLGAGGLLKSVNQVGLKPIVIRGTFSHNNSPIELDLCTGILIIFQEGAERMNIYLVDYWSSVIEEKFKNGSSITSVVKSETSGKVTITAASGNFTYLFIGYNYRI